MAAQADPGHVQALRACIRHGLGVEALRSILRQPDVAVNVGYEGDLTALQLVAISGYADEVELLLAYGADARLAYEGVTPLHFAAAAAKQGYFRDYVRVVKALVAAHADPNAVDMDGKTPLHRACAYRACGTARVLLEAGARIDIRDAAGHSPLHVTLRQRDDHNSRYSPLKLSEVLPMVQLLVSWGATWDTSCHTLVATSARPALWSATEHHDAYAGAAALRVCVLVWQQDHADGLALTDIPIETIRRGADHVAQYVADLKKSLHIDFRRRVCLVGPSGAGKTSLVHSLRAERPELAHADDRTVGIDRVSLRFPEYRYNRAVRIHEVAFWDFAGQEEYQVAHALFFSARTLYLVCVDLEAYLVAYMQADITTDTPYQREQMLDEFIERDVLRWVRLICACQPDAEFVFVATKADVLGNYGVFNDEIKSFLAKKLHQVDGIVRTMKREVEAGDSNDGRCAHLLTLHAYEQIARCSRSGSAATGLTPEQSTSTGLPRQSRNGRDDTKPSWRRRVIERLKRTVTRSGHARESPVKFGAAVRLHEERASRRDRAKPIYVSCADASSVARARGAVRAMVCRSQRSFPMPDSYRRVFNTIVATREAAEKGTARARVDRVFVPVTSLVASLETRETGATACRQVLQVLHDLGEVLWYERLGIELFEHVVILDPMLLVEFVRHVFNHKHQTQTLCHSTLRRLPCWAELGDDAPRLLAMKRLLQKFQLVLPSHGEMQWDSDLLVPAYWRANTCAAWRFGGEDVRLASNEASRDSKSSGQERVRIHWQYEFAHEFPGTLFDHLVVASYSPFTPREAGPDWILYRQERAFACRAMLCREISSHHRVLRLEAVLATAASDAESEELWDAFECLSEAIERVVRRYRGLVVTSFALDHAQERTHLESLFAFPLKAAARTWMPRHQSWERYKLVVAEQRSASGA